MLLCKKIKTNNELQQTKKELSNSLKIAIGYQSINDFAKKCGIVDIKMLTEILNEKINELPDRRLLRKIANASEGRITHYQLYFICEYKESDKEEDYSWEKWTPKRGETFYVDLGKGYDSEQGRIRPFTVLSNNKGNSYGNIVVGVPISKVRKNMPKIHVPISREFGLEKDSYALTEHIRSISKRRFFFNGDPWKITTLPESKMLEIQHALEFELGFEPLMFNESKAFDMIKHIKSLENTLKTKTVKKKDLITMLDEKFNELNNYCSKYYKDHQIIINEYERTSGYTCAT